MGGNVATQEEYDMIEFGDEEVYLPSTRRQLLLRVLLDPKKQQMSIVEKLKTVGITFAMYQRAMADPRFSRAYQKLLFESYKGDATAVMKAMRDYGINNEKNHSDRKEFLKIVGLIEDKKTIDINRKNLNVNVDVDNVDSMATEDIKEMIREMIKEDPTLIEGIVLDGDKK